MSKYVVDEREMRRRITEFWEITYPTWCFYPREEDDGKIKGLAEWLKVPVEESDKEP